MNIKESIKGKNIKEVWMNDDYLKLVTSDGDVCFGVRGGCCSISYFYGIVGIKPLIENGEVKEVEELELESVKGTEYGLTQRYGYRLTTESLSFGERSTVISFRNESNGYYGGWMEVVDSIPEGEELEKIPVDNDKIIIHED